MTAAGQFTLRNSRLGLLPIVNFFVARIGVEEQHATSLPHYAARLCLAPAAVIEVVVVRNLVTGNRPVCALVSGRSPTNRRYSQSQQATSRCSTTTG